MNYQLCFKLLIINTLLIISFINLKAQDPRERNYMYPVLKPVHEPKPLVTGWASKRVVEKFNRGLTAQRTSPQTVYLSWRLLAEDSPQVAFNIYRELAGKKPVKINKKPIM